MPHTNDCQRDLGSLEAKVEYITQRLTQAEQKLDHIPEIREDIEEIKNIVSDSANELTMLKDAIRTYRFAKKGIQAFLTIIAAIMGYVKLVKPYFSFTSFLDNLFR